MNNQSLEEIIIAWFEGELENSEREDFMERINSSKEGKELFETYKMIYADLDNEEMATPSSDFKTKFHTSLKEQDLHFKKNKVIRFQYLKYAAAVLLLVTVGILIGLNISKNNQLNHLSDELIAMKTEMKNLLQNESTAQRIRAVKMSSQFVETDNDLLKVLIKTMNSDKSENVRIAAIDALENFAHEEIVQQAFLKNLEIQKEDFTQIKLIRILAQAKNKNTLPFLDKIITNKKTSKYLRSEATESKRTIINL